MNSQIKFELILELQGIKNCQEYSKIDDFYFLFIPKVKVGIFSFNPENKGFATVKLYEYFLKDEPLSQLRYPSSVRVSRINSISLRFEIGMTSFLAAISSVIASIENWVSLLLENIRSKAAVACLYSFVTCSIFICSSAFISASTSLAVSPINLFK